MRDCLHFLTVIFIAVNGYGQQHLDTGIKQLFDVQMEKMEVKNAFLQVYSKSNGINIQFADNDDRTEDAPTMENPIYTASITKMFTATAIGILKDNGKLNFEDQIYQHLPEQLMKKPACARWRRVFQGHYHRPFIAAHFRLARLFYGHHR